MFAVEKNIPVPGPHANHTYPLKKMAVGDSFAVPVGSEKASVIQNRLSNAANHSGKKSGAKFTTRICGDVVRVWRIS